MNDSSETLKDKLLEQALEEKLGGRRPPDLSEQILSGVERKSNARTGWQVVSLTVALGLLFLAGVTLIVPAVQETTSSGRFASNEGEDVKDVVVKAAAPLVTPSETSLTSLSSSELAVIRKAVQKKYDAMLKRYGELKYVTVEHLVVEEVAKFKVHRVERQLREEAQQAKEVARLARIEARIARKKIIEAARPLVIKPRCMSREQREIYAIFARFSKEGLPPPLPFEYVDHGGILGDYGVWPDTASREETARKLFRDPGISLNPSETALAISYVSEALLVHVASAATLTLSGAATDFNGTLVKYGRGTLAVTNRFDPSGAGTSLTVSSGSILAAKDVSATSDTVISISARSHLGGGGTLTLYNGVLQTTATLTTARSVVLDDANDGAGLDIVGADENTTVFNAFQAFGTGESFGIAANQIVVVTGPLTLGDGASFSFSGGDATFTDASTTLAGDGTITANSTIAGGPLSLSGTLTLGGIGTQSYGSITTTGTGRTIDFTGGGIVTSPDFDDQSSGARTVGIAQSASADGRMVFTGGNIVATDTTFTVNPGATLAGEGPAPLGAGQTVTLNGGRLELSLGGGTISPTLEQSGAMNVRYDAATIAIGGGQQITAWADISGNDRHLGSYQGTPVYVTDAGGGLPAVNFENESLVMDVADEYLPKDAYIVFRSSNQDNPIYWSAEDHGGDDRTSRLSRNEKNFWDGEKPSKVVWNGTNIPDSNHFDISNAVPGTDLGEMKILKVELNNGPQERPVIVGSRTDAWSNGYYDTAEVLLFSDKMSAKEKAELGRHLAKKYGIDITGTPYEDQTLRVPHVSGDLDMSTSTHDVTGAGSGLILITDGTATFAGLDLDATGVTLDVSTAAVNITSGTLTTDAALNPASIHVNPSTGTDLDITFSQASFGLANASTVDPLRVAIGDDVTETRVELRFVDTDNKNLAQHTDPDTLSSGTYRVISTGTQRAILWDRNQDGVFESNGNLDSNGEQLAWQDGGWKNVTLTGGEGYMIAFTHVEGGDGSQMRGSVHANHIGLTDRVIRPQGDAAQDGILVTGETLLGVPSAPGTGVLARTGGSVADRSIDLIGGSLTVTDGGVFEATDASLTVNSTGSLDLLGGTLININLAGPFGVVVNTDPDTDTVIDLGNGTHTYSGDTVIDRGALVHGINGGRVELSGGNDVALHVGHGTLSDAVPMPPLPKPAKTWADTKEILAVADKLSPEKEAELDRQLVVKYGITLEEIRTAHDRRVHPIVRADTGRTGNRYAKITENDFHGPGKAPLSTFSIDVDTASYAITRRALMESRRLPPPNAVRIEELVNYFHYDYGPPKDERPFAAHMEVAGCPWQPKHRLVRIALKGKEIHHQERPAANLVFLVDVSGSMGSRDKLPLVQRGLQMLVESLSGRDRVGLVVYASRTGMVLPSTNIDQRELILSKIGELSSGGSTNGGDGIRLAYEQAQKNFIKGGINRVILCTDGDFNVGTVNTKQLVDLVKEKAQGGVFITALGFGTGNHNDAMMEKISNSGNGNYFYVDSQAEARKVFVEELSGTLVTIAKDVKIQVEFNPEEVDAYRLIGYENRRLAAKDFNDDKKDAGEIGAGHTVTAIYEIVPTAAAASTPDGQPAVDRLKYQKVAKKAVRPAKKTKKTTKNHGGEMLTLKIRYKQPDGHKSTKIEFVLKDDGTRFANASDEMQFASAVASFGMLLRGSKYRGDANFDSVLEIAGAAIGEDKQGRRKEFLDMVRQAKGLR